MLENGTTTSAVWYQQVCWLLSWTYAKRPAVLPTITFKPSVQMSINVSEKKKKVLALLWT